MRWRALGRGLLVLALGGLVAAAPVVRADRSHGAARGSILIFNFSLGFHHLSVPHATDVLTRALETAGYDVTVSARPSDLTAGRLAHTDAVVWLSTTGGGGTGSTTSSAAPFSASQRRHFEDWMTCGGGNVGVHAVLGPTFQGWPAWSRIWGTGEGGEPLTETSVADDETPRYEGWGQFLATLKVDDHTSPATAPWGRVTTVQERDEFYHWTTDPSRVVPDFHQLLGFDGFTDPRTALQSSSAGYWFDMPVAWTGSYQHTNRDFYTNLGHSTTIWDDPAFVAHVVGGTRWVTGIRPDRRCLAAHGMGTATAATPPSPTSVVGASPPAPPTSPSPAGAAMTCGFVGQLVAGGSPVSPTGASAARLYGGLGDCNGQLDAACSFTTPACSDPAHATAGVEAGEYYIDPATDQRYQEPRLTAIGSCSQGTVSGDLLISWPDHGLTVVSLSSVGGQVTGSVLDKLTLLPLSRGSAAHRSLTVLTTALRGYRLTGSLSFANCTPTTGPNLFLVAPNGGQVSGALALVA